MRGSGNARASLGIQSSHQKAESNGCLTLATKGPGLTYGAPGTIENSASCTAIPSTNRRFGISIGLPGSQVRLFARGFGNTLSREARHGRKLIPGVPLVHALPETHHFSSRWSSDCVP